MGIVDAVTRGMAELDQRVIDWRERVDLSTLDMYSHRDCILGQLFGSYYAATEILDLDDEAVLYYGFEVADPSSKADYAKLTDEWKQRLTGATI